MTATPTIGSSMKTYSKLLPALLLLILVVPQVGGEPPENGKHVEYHENGQKMSESNYKNGKLNLLTLWYENGQKESETHFRNGKREGLLTLWYPNGQKRSETHYKNGKEDGLGTYWYENGQKALEIEYKDGKEISRKKY